MSELLRIVAGWLPPAAVTGVDSRNLVQRFVFDGGPITWFVLMPLSVITLALVLHYLISVRRGTQTPAGLARAVVTTARQGQIRSILEITRDDDTMLGRAAHAGCTQIAAGAGREAVVTAIDEAVDAQAGRLMRRIEYLNVIGNVSPMIGLLGTVVGMIQAFMRISAAGKGAPDASGLVGDIAIALVNTFWGLFIAIPGLSAYAVLRNRVDAFAAECIKVCDVLAGVVGSGSESGSEPDRVRVG